MALVEYAREGAVGRLTLNRPEAGNAVDPEFIADLAKAIEAACADPGRAILIDARGANFSLGGGVRYLPRFRKWRGGCPARYGRPLP